MKEVEAVFIFDFAWQDEHLSHAIFIARDYSSRVFLTNEDNFIETNAILSDYSDAMKIGYRQ